MTWVAVLWDARRVGLSDEEAIMICVFLGGVDDVGCGWCDGSGKAHGVACDQCCGTGTFHKAVERVRDLEAELLERGEEIARLRRYARKLEDALGGFDR